MTKKMFMAVACLGAAMGLATTAYGQSMETVRVNLPYETQVGKVSLPAGAYSIKRVTNNVVQISSDARKGENTFATVTPIVAKDGKSKDHTNVVLHESDNGSYQLQSIWLEGQDVGFELVASE